MATEVGVVGLWHLGCTIAAAWSGLGHRVHAVEFDESVATQIATGRAPLFEPGLDEALAAGIKGGRLSVTSDPTVLSACAFVFVAYDTPVRDDDSSDTTVIEQAIERIAPHLGSDAIVVMSAQLPVGTARRLRARLKAVSPGCELTYSPENLRLGEALSCYRKPGHIVIGADDEAAGDGVERLFAPMDGVVLRMSLPSAEMAKHGINSFLATSITFSNQLADLCSASGADFADVAAAMRRDPRIGSRAYLTPGIGFSGGTLGRDLRVLESVSQTAGDAAPLFGALWSYNHRRHDAVRARCERELGTVSGRTLSLLGMTYKPGTSTLRRSLPLEVARSLAAAGARLRAYDPKADWSTETLPDGLEVCGSAYDAARGSDAAIVLTEWPEFRDLDLGQLRKAMAGTMVFDTKDVLRHRRAEMGALGFRLIGIGHA
jgi:UDPglucose 6-dehydrogenase